MSKKGVHLFQGWISHELPKLWMSLKNIKVSSLIAQTQGSVQSAPLHFEKLKVRTLQFLLRQQERAAREWREVSRRGLQFGGLLGLIGTLITLASLVYFGDRSEKDAIELAQNSLESSTRVLGAHFKYKIQGFKEIVRMVATSQTQGLTEETVSPTLDDFTSIPELLDVSIWALNGRSSALEVGPQYSKARMLVNRNARELSPERIQNLIRSELIEKKEIPKFSRSFESIQIADPTLQQNHKVVLLALKIPHPKFQFIAVAHLQLSSLYSAFHDQDLAFAAFTDDDGAIILDSTSASKLAEVSPRDLIPPLVEVAHSKITSRGQFKFQDAQAREYFGSYERVGVGKSAVLTVMPLEMVTRGLSIFTPRSLILLFISFMIYFAYGYSMFSQSTQLPPELTAHDKKRLSPKKTSVSVLHGSLRQLFHLLEIETPEKAQETLNEFLTLAAQAIRKRGGLFEKVSGRSFIGVWGAPDAQSGDPMYAVEAAVELRKAYFTLNEARRVDGQKPFAYTLAVHEGEVLAAHLGPSGELQYAVAGDVIQQTYMLEGIALSQKKDLLISEAVNQQLKGQFQTQAVGEAKLTAASGWVAYHEVLAQLSAEGRWIELPVHPQAVQDSSPVGAILETQSIEVLTPPQRDPRWVVNNGNQIIGPFSPKEVAQLLFSQELDFDCECWEETSGRASQIKDSGMFSGASEDSSAHLWMFDGEIIHGPVTLGFVQTARTHAALSSQVWICEGSTLNGWKSMDEFFSSPTGVPPLSSSETIAPAPPSSSFLVRADLSIEALPVLEAVQSVEPLSHSPSVSIELLPSVLELPIILEPPQAGASEGLSSGASESPKESLAQGEEQDSRKKAA